MIEEVIELARMVFCDDDENDREVDTNVNTQNAVESKIAGLFGADSLEDLTSRTDGLTYLDRYLS